MGKKNHKHAADAAQMPALERFRLPEGKVALADLTTSRFPGPPKDKAAGEKAMAAMAPKLEALQERLYAAGLGGDRRRILIVLQGMDTAGKDGVIKDALGLLNPAGVKLASFKKPTEEERQHDFLWRIEKQLPPPGYIGVFNRSQYEDVLIVRVHHLVPAEEWGKRYAQINEFERKLVRGGTTLIKCFLHVSKKVQAERLAARLEDPTKYWKYNPGDLDERKLWDDYQEAYRVALEKTSTVGAPWYVIPSDHKWYRNWAVASLLLETLEELDPQYPPATYDVKAEQIRVAAAAQE